MLQQHLGSNHSLIVLPDDSEQPFLDALNKAQESLPVKMFVFSDPALNVAPAAEIARRGEHGAGSGHIARRASLRLSRP